MGQPETSACTLLLEKTNTEFDLVYEPLPGPFSSMARKSSVPSTAAALYPRSREPAISYRMSTTLGILLTRVPKSLLKA